MIIIKLKPKKEESLLRFHPWVFSGAIQTINGKPSEGELVEVVDNQNNFLAIGHYQIGSIAVRIGRRPAYRRRLPSCRRRYRHPPP